MPETTREMPTQEMEGFSVGQEVKVVRRRTNEIETGWKIARFRTDNRGVWCADVGKDGQEKLVSLEDLREWQNE